MPVSIQAIPIHDVEELFAKALRIDIEFESLLRLEAGEGNVEPMSEEAFSLLAEEE